jgi:hypothetical protein
VEIYGPGQGGEALVETGPVSANKRELKGADHHARACTVRVVLLISRLINKGSSVKLSKCVVGREVSLYVCIREWQRSEGGGEGIYNGHHKEAQEFSPPRGYQPTLLKLEQGAKNMPKLVRRSDINIPHLEISFAHADQ